MVYITEAHAADIWPIGMSAGTINYEHKCIEDRSKCAYKFKSEYDFDIPIYLDNMANEYETKYSCWPFRYHIIVDDDNGDNGDKGFNWYKILKPIKSFLFGNNTKKNKGNNGTKGFKMSLVPTPVDSEFDMGELFDHLEKLG